MTEIFCDIVPQPSGWVFKIEGADSPEFPSYRLAYEAAQRYREEATDDRHSVVVRHQDLKGQMRRVSPTSHAFAPSLAATQPSA